MADHSTWSAERASLTDPLSQAGPAAVGVETIRIEAQALVDLALAMETGSLGEAFARAAQALMSATGRVVVSGVGKSGLIGRKLAATFASTGTPSLFIHAADAGHGDLGMIATGDVLVLLSWSGETSELSDLISYSRRFGIPLIAMTASADSTLAMQSDVLLLMPTVREACPNRLAPTSSTAMQLALGDALAVALVNLRGFTSDEFRVFHPRGKLAAQLIRVSDIMSTGQKIPRVPQDTTVLEAAIEISHKRLGITAIVEGGELIGAFSDGDLRRTVESNEVTALVGRFMSRDPWFINPGALASEALALMNRNNISQLFVCEEGKLTGIIHIHDILRIGVV